MTLEKKDQDGAGQREFRRLIEELYRGFPRLALREDEVRKVLLAENQINQLVEKGYLVREPYAEDGRTVYRYMLGANSLSLVASRRAEKLNAILVALTFWVAGTGVAEGLFKINWISSSLFGIFLLILSALCLFQLMAIHFRYR
jgi:hypothetical protein